MPVVLRIGPYRFYFWSRENAEPPHIHVGRERMEAKFRIDPAVELARNRGFARAGAAKDPGPGGTTPGAVGGGVA